MKKCKWQYHNYTAHYETDCGHAFEFSNLGGPIINGFKFCPYCGGKIEQGYTEQELSDIRTAQQED